MEEDIKYEMVVFWSDEDEAYVVEVLDVVSTNILPGLSYQV